MRVFSFVSFGPLKVFFILCHSKLFFCMSFDLAENSFFDSYCDGVKLSPFLPYIGL